MTYKASYQQDASDQAARVVGRMLQLSGSGTAAWLRGSDCAEEHLVRSAL